MSETVLIRPLEPSDKEWVSALLEREWGSTRVVAGNRIHLADSLPGFVAQIGGEPLGLITYSVQGDECEIVSLNSLKAGVGIGTALIDAVRQDARRAGCRRLVLITTNDNTFALAFYQKRGFRLYALHRNALKSSRRLKPEIPLIGIDGIPLRDELELDLVIQ